MAESSLSLSWVELKEKVGWFLNYGRSGWNTAQEAEIDDIVQSGVRRVYYPPAVERGDVGHEWSWLRPSTTLSIYGPYTDADGTCSVTAGVVTKVGATTDWPAWAADAILIIDGVSYAVDTRDDADQITLVDTSLTDTSITSWSLNQEDYDLPDDMGRIYDRINWPDDEYRSPMERIPVGDILAKRSRASLTGPPIWFATRHKTSTGVTGQRQEILFYPRPDTNRTLPYQYEAYASALSDSFPYPLGGMKMAELYVESCLSVAEQQSNDEIGIHTQTFKTLLIDAVERDRQHGGKNYGNMGNRERDYHLFRRGYAGSTYPIDYKGETI